MLATAAKRRHRRNRYVSIEKRERERERFGSDRRRELLDRGDPRGLNESACSPLVPYSVSFFSFLFSIHRLASSRFPSSPRRLLSRQDGGYTRSSAITTFYPPSFSHDGSSTTGPKRCKTRPVERISRVVPIRDKEDG